MHEARAAQAAANTPDTRSSYQPAGWTISILGGVDLPDLPDLRPAVRPYCHVCSAYPQNILFAIFVQIDH